MKVKPNMAMTPKRITRVDDEADDGDEAGHAVVDQHENESHREGEAAGDEALLDDGCAEGGGDGAHFLDDQRVFQRVHQ